jgi:hypothetical protein
MEKFMDWYSENYSNGVFTYPKDWDGFNLPGKIIRKWIDKFQNEHGDIRIKEHELLKALEMKLKEDGRSLSEIYVIGVHSQKQPQYLEKAIEHETAHAFYEIYPKYKKACKKMLKDVPKSVISHSKKKLTNIGYGKNVLDDELQAYFSTEDKTSSGVKGRKVFASHFKTFKKNLKKS